MAGNITLREWKVMPIISTTADTINMATTIS
jgi:hypothetical protein